VVEILKQLFCEKGYNCSLKVTYEGYYKENPYPEKGKIVKLLTGDNFYNSRSNKCNLIKYPKKYTADTLRLIVSRPI
jgi:hypothetical protein